MVGMGYPYSGVMSGLQNAFSRRFGKHAEGSDPPIGTFVLHDEHDGFPTVRRDDYGGIR